MARIRVERVMSADPTSIALLLADPEVALLWPGVRSAEGGPADLRVVADLSERGPVVLTVEAAPPARTPTAFVHRFSFAGGGVPPTDAVLCLDYAPPAAEGTARTAAVLRISYPGPAPDRLRRLAAGFMANLARAAERRARAA